MNRRNQLLAGALFVQLVIILLVTTLRAPASSSAGKPLFDGLKSSDVTRLALQDAKGRQIELAKQGDAWVLPQSDDFPADAARITAFLDKLAKVQTGRLIARTASSYARLQVADDNFVDRVDFTLANGSSHTLLVGSSPAGGDVHVRGDGAAEVYLTDAIGPSDPSPEASAWITTTYLTANSDDVNAFTLSNHNGTFAFAKNDLGSWTFKGLAAADQFDPSRLTELLPAISSLNMTSPLGKTPKPEYGLDAPGAIVTVTLKSQATSVKPLVLRVGAKDAAGNSYVVSSSESPYIVRVDSYSVENLVTRTQQDFLKPQPTAAPQATPTQ
jgi:hypothetical protein